MRQVGLKLNSDPQMEKGHKHTSSIGGGGVCYYSVLQRLMCVKGRYSDHMLFLLSGSGLVPLLLPGLGLIQTLICDGHDLLEDVTNVLLLLWLLAEVMVCPYVVRITYTLLRPSC